MTKFRRMMLISAAAAGVGGAALAEEQFAGTWQVSDTNGKPFEIVLKDDGTASANRAGEGMSGKWTKSGSAAVITWDTGWTTKISEQGDGYVKTAYKDGQSPDAKPANSSEATKVK